MGHANTTKARARKRAGRRCAPRQAAPACAAIEAPPLIEEAAPEPIAARPNRHAEIARALAVVVDVETACEDDNAELEFVSAPTPQPPSEPAQTVVETADEEPPFDPPDADDDIFRPPTHARRWSDPDILDLHTPAPPSFPHEPNDTRPPPRPAPAVSVHISWDREAGAALANQLAAHPLLSRADITDERGGVGALVNHLEKANPPDLLIIDTTLKAQPLLSALETLQASLRSTTKLFIIGETNDVGLLRDLARRGVAQYFLAPGPASEIARAICDLYAEADRSHVIAVVGSRGGVGASTIAHNIAWSIAERQDASTTLIELDFAFGATAFSFDQRSAHPLAAGMRDPGLINEAFLDRVGVQQSERLRLLPAPASLDDGLELQQRTIGALIRTARRTSAFVVIDVPHQWNACVKDVLERANDVVLIATPDLASLRNAKAMADVMKRLRPAGHEPMLALSMTGAGKGVEISERDFAAAADLRPMMSFAFDPALFSGSVFKRQMLGEMAPQSVAARQIDDIACLLTGRRQIKRKQRRKAAAPTPETSPPARPPLALTEPASELRTLALPPTRPRALSRHQVQPRPRQSRAQRGTLRLTAALIALIASGMWLTEKHTDVHFIRYAIASQTR